MHTQVFTVEQRTNRRAGSIVDDDDLVGEVAGMGHDRREAAPSLIGMAVGRHDDRDFRRGRVGERELIRRRARAFADAFRKAGARGSGGTSVPEIMGERAQAAALRVARRIPGRIEQRMRRKTGSLADLDIVGERAAGMPSRFRAFRQIHPGVEDGVRARTRIAGGDEVLQRRLSHRQRDGEPCQVVGGVEEGVRIVSQRVR